MSTPARTFNAGVVSGTSLVRAAVLVQRGVAVVLIILSTLGNFIQFNGGWERWNVLDGRGMQALAWAIVWQALFLCWQWAMLYVRAYNWYVFALLASCVPSYLSYQALTYEPLRVYIVSQQVPDGLAQVLATSLILIAVFGSDAVPERVLVKRSSRPVPTQEVP